MNFTLEQARKTHRVSRGIALLFLQPRRQMEVVNATPWPLYPRGSNLVPTVEEAGWDSKSVWTGASKLAPTKTRSANRPAHNESLYRLLYPGHYVHKKKRVTQRGFVIILLKLE